MNLQVGIGDMKYSTSPEDIIKTQSLGSCVGLVLYDPLLRIGGMVHCMLPLSKAAKDKAAANPFLFTDTGVMGLIQAVLDAGADKKRLIARVAGAAKVLDGADHFKTGQRNYTVLRKVLWKNGIMIESERVGGTDPRTMILYMDTGRTTTVTRREETDLCK